MGRGDRKEGQERLRLAFLTGGEGMSRYDVSQVPVSPSRVSSRVLLAGNARCSDYLAASEWQRFTPRSDHNGVATSRAFMQPLSNNIMEGREGREARGRSPRLKEVRHSTRSIVRRVRAIRLMDGWIGGCNSGAHMGGTGRRDKSIGASTRIR